MRCARPSWQAAAKLSGPINRQYHVKSSALFHACQKLHMRVQQSCQSQGCCRVSLSHTQCTISHLLRFDPVIPVCSKAVKAWIEQHKAKRAVVVGGGFIGIEMVENLVHRGLDTTLVEMQNQVCA
jgi:hypothetical protein